MNENILTRVVTGLFVDPLSGDGESGEGLHLLAGGVVEGRLVVLGVGRGNAMDLLLRDGGLGPRLCREEGMKELITVMLCSMNMWREREREQGLTVT